MSGQSFDMSGQTAVVFVVLGVIVLLGAYGLTGVLRRYALARELVDAPGPRSSHQMPTPRGGGLSIVVSALGAMTALWWLQLLPAATFVGMAGAGALVAAAGFWDDHGHLAPPWRLAIHAVGAGWGLYWLGGFPQLVIAGVSVDFGLAGEVLILLLLVWLTNLYNFMDGIDAIAAVEAITVCLGGATVNWLANASSVGTLLPAMFAVACAGFLLWNLPPAKIFMGDVGSGFVGVALGLLWVQSGWLQPELLWAWLILLGVFVTDATVTLLRRWVRGEKVYHAHRSHAYQYAARRYGSHGRVSTAVAVINIVWLLPLAASVASGWLAGPVAVLLAYLPLITLAWHYKAGDRGAQARDGLA